MILKTAKKKIKLEESTEKRCHFSHYTAPGSATQRNLPREVPNLERLDQMIFPVI